MTVYIYIISFLALAPKSWENDVDHVTRSYENSDDIKIDKRIQKWNQFGK